MYTPPPDAYDKHAGVCSGTWTVYTVYLDAAQRKHAYWTKVGADMYFIMRSIHT